MNFLPFKFSDVPEVILQVIKKKSPRHISVKVDHYFSGPALLTSVFKERVTFG